MSFLNKLLLLLTLPHLQFSQLKIKRSIRLSIFPRYRPISRYLFIHEYQRSEGQLWVQCLAFNYNEGSDQDTKTQLWAKCVAIKYDTVGSDQGAKRQLWAKCLALGYDVREVLKVVRIQREARLRCRETTKATSLVLRKGTMAVVKVKRDNFFKKLIALGYKTRAVARVERDKFGIFGGKLESTCYFGHHTHPVAFI